MKPSIWNESYPPRDAEADRELVNYQKRYCRPALPPPRLPCAPPSKSLAEPLSRLVEPLGLDPSVYRVTVAVDRVDGAPLSEGEVEQLRAALAPYRAPSKAAAKPGPAKKRSGLF